MKKQAARFGATFELAHLNSVKLDGHPIRLHTSSGEVATRTLIIASGASARWLGLPSEQALIGHGVSSCATCDGFFFRGKEIAVVGGGDSAMEEALFLTRFATKVTLLHRRESFRASKIMLERAMAHPNIALRTNTVVEEVLGVEEKEVRGLRLKDVTNGVEDELKISGLFLGIGHLPNATRLPWPDGSRRRGIHQDRGQRAHHAQWHRDPRRLRLRRRAGPPLSPGHYRCRFRLHGRA